MSVPYSNQIGPEFRLPDGSLESFAWPGGYPIVYQDGHGETLCPACASVELLTAEIDRAWAAAVTAPGQSGPALGAQQPNSPTAPAPAVVRLVKLRIEHLPDDDPDLSWLEQDCMQPEGTYRLHAYGESWCCIGIRAVARILVPTGPAGHGILQEVSSGGLWGIESDSDWAYQMEVAREELAALRGILETMGVDVSNWDELAQLAEEVNHAADC